MKRNWLTALVATVLWGTGGLFAAGSAAPARASEPSYCVCPYVAEDFGRSYEFGSDWYLLGPESPGVDRFLAALDAAENEEAEEANKFEAKDKPTNALPIENANCLFDKSTGESYARYLVEQVYKLYFAEKDRAAPQEAIVADPADHDPLLCPAEQDYLDWRLDALAGGYEYDGSDDAPVAEALASEASHQRDRLELEPARQREYDWEAYEYDWTGADDPAFADEEANDKVATGNEEADDKVAASDDAKKVEQDYAQAERLSAFEEYSLWEQNYGDCAEAAEAWAAVQELEDEFANYWDNVVLSGSVYVAPKAIPASSVRTIVLNGSPSGCTPTIKSTLVRDEDFAAPGQHVPTIREEESYPLAVLAAHRDRLNLSDEAVARIASGRIDDATTVSAIDAAAKPFFSLGETARRAIRDLVLSDDEQAALRLVAKSAKESLLR